MMQAAKKLAPEHAKFCLLVPVCSTCKRPPLHVMTNAGMHYLECANCKPRTFECHTFEQAAKKWSWMVIA